MNIGDYERKFGGTVLRGAHSVVPRSLGGTSNRNEMVKAIRGNRPDGVGTTFVKQAETNAGHAPGARKTPQQQRGAWCPACRHHHRPGSTCVNALKPMG